MMMRKLLFLICALFAHTIYANSIDFAGRVNHILEQYGENIQVSIYAVDNSKENHSLQINSNVTRRAASSIKPAILIELFAKYQGKLSKQPEELPLILYDDEHPALAHYTREQLTEMREHLYNATIEDIGRLMIRRNGKPSATYNGATNIAIALLGGPKQVTKKIQARDPAFADIEIGRYMNTAGKYCDRKNTTSTPTLVALHQHIEQGNINGLSKKTITKLRDILRYKDDPILGIEYAKGGDLMIAERACVPLVRVRAGWLDKAPKKIFYAIMTEQANPNNDRAKKYYQQQKSAVNDIKQLIFEQLS